MGDFGAASPADLASLANLMSMSAGIMVEGLAEGLAGPAIDDVVEYQDDHAMIMDATITGLYDDPTVVDLRVGQRFYIAVHYEADGAANSWRSK